MIPDTIYTGDNVETLRQFPDACIDLVVTSPPYDNLRTYGGHTWDFEGVARELTRVLKPGGVIVWVVADATVKGSETLTSMRQAIHFKDVCGLRVHDTMIYQKVNPVPNEVGYRYQAAFEYMFVFTKGKPATFNPLKVPCVMFGKVKPKRDGKQFRQADGSMKASHGLKYNKPEKFRHNIWQYTLTGAREHPAAYPEALARDHILSWSNEGDVVLDPFAGSGTTCLAARDAGRKYVGIEINPEYIEIINRRLGLANDKLTHGGENQ